MEFYREAHVPTECAGPQASPRLSCPYGERRRSSRYRTSSRQRSQAPQRLSLMAPHLRRLKKRYEFLRVARSGRKWATPGLVLQASRRLAPSPGEAKADHDDIGVGLTASRKVGSAVERNRARRRLRAAADEVLPLFGEAGRDYVLIARKATVRRSYEALIADLQQAVKRLATKNESKGPGGPDRLGKAKRS